VNARSPICCKCAQAGTDELGPVSVMSLPDGGGEDGPIHDVCWQSLFEETREAFEIEHHQTPRDIAIAYYGTGVGRLSAAEESAAGYRGELWVIKGTDVRLDLAAAAECEQLGIALVKVLTPRQRAMAAEWNRLGVGAN
jgi:hypothetical protein